MKSILISVKPKYVADILNYKKTIEVRKVMPKCDLPIDVYIYCTKDNKNKLCYVDYEPCGSKGYLTTKLDCEDEELNGKVVAKFTLKKCEEWHNYSWYEITKKGCVSDDELRNYSKGKASLFIWHIDNLVIFDEPKELSEFECSCPTEKCCKCKYAKFMCGQIACNKPELTKAPQSFMYIETEDK